MAAAYWLCGLAIYGLIQFLVLRGKPAEYRWKWHPLLSAPPTAVTVGAVFAWSPALGPAILFATFAVCVGTQIALGSQFCGSCGADTRNPFYRYTNWPNCPKCGAVVPQTPDAARRLFFLQFAAFAFLILAGGFALQAGIVAVILVSSAGLALHILASLRFYREVQVPMREAAGDHPRDELFLPGRR